MDQVTYCESCGTEIFAIAAYCTKCGTLRTPTPAVASVASAVTGDIPQPVEGDGLVECPQCAETIKARAKVCRFCGTSLEVRASTPKSRALRKARSKSEARAARRSHASSSAQGAAVGIVGMLLIVVAVFGFFMSQWVTHQMAWVGVAIFGALLLILRAVGRRAA